MQHTSIQLVVFASVLLSCVVLLKQQVGVTMIGALGANAFCLPNCIVCRLWSLGFFQVVIKGRTQCMPMHSYHQSCPSNTNLPSIINHHKTIRISCFAVDILMPNRVQKGGWSLLSYCVSDNCCDEIANSFTECDVESIKSTFVCPCLLTVAVLE